MARGIWPCGRVACGRAHCAACVRNQRHVARVAVRNTCTCNRGPCGTVRNMPRGQCGTVRNTPRGLCGGTARAYGESLSLLSLTPRASRWNVAQVETLAAVNESRRFYSINRAWSPGMARLGATVWTGDINPTWDGARRPHHP
eukprot:5914042-Prymnesium_polylepis.1